MFISKFYSPIIHGQIGLDNKFIIAQIPHNIQGIFFFNYGNIQGVSKKQSKNDPKLNLNRKKRKRKKEICHYGTT